MNLLLSAALLGVSCSNVRANFLGEIGKTYMRDLGMPEPLWNAIRQGSATEDAIVPNAATQVWGNVEPGALDTEPLCKWTAGSQNSGKGTCKTDISWLHSAVGIEKSFFNDPVVNYILRFHLPAACYRSTQSSYNAAAQYCASWWLDVGKNEKIDINDICYTWEWVKDWSPLGSPIWQQNGCLHMAPVPNAAEVIPPTNTTAPTARRMLRNAADAPASEDDGMIGDIRILSSRSDVVDVETFYADTGKEYANMHTSWYGCKSGANTGTPLNGDARIICQNDVASLAFNMDAETIQTFLQLVQNETRGAAPPYEGVNCAGRFTAAVGTAADAAAAKELCEGIVSQQARMQTLFAWDFTGTPTEPSSLKPIVYPPPPPPPGVPPRPPMPPPPPPPPPIVGGSNNAGSLDLTPTRGNSGDAATVVVSTAALAMPFLAAVLVAA